eukprot:2374012-Pyramimonas_sp.AAC.1
MGRVEQQQWSFLNVPIYWTTAGVQDDRYHRMAGTCDRTILWYPSCLLYTYSGAGAARGAFQAIRRNMRHMG